ncbi:MAG: hypothetical protein JJT96_17505 [Opitutales bacterium]|nr:hypothetical protein [Opitutales bacterium]
MKNDSDPSKPKLKLSLPKKPGDDAPEPSAEKEGPKAPRSQADPASRKLNTGRKTKKADPDFVEPVEIEPGEEVFWEVFEMDNLGFGEEGTNSPDEKEGSQPPPAESKSGSTNPDPSKPSIPLSKLRPSDPNQAAHSPNSEPKTKDIDESFFDDEENEETPPVLLFGGSMLIGDSEDQIAQGPGRLTPEEERPPKLPPPLNAPLAPINPDLLYGQSAKDRDPQDPEEQDEFDFLASTEFDEVRPSKERADEESRETSPATENTRLMGRRFWVGLGLIAAIAGATAFTLSIKRESRPVDSPPSTRIVSGSAPVSPAPRLQDAGSADSSAPQPLPEPSAALHSPESAAAIQSLVDGFIISVAHPEANRPRIIINEVTVPVGALLDPATALRLVQIQNDPRTLVFEDGAGRTFTRNF